MYTFALRTRDAGQVHVLKGANLEDAVARRWGAGAQWEPFTPYMGAVSVDGKQVVVLETLRTKDPRR